MKSVLVVDDVKVNQMLFSSFLKKNFENVEIAENGLVAYEKCQKQKYDIIIMDIQMPLINGLDATQLIRKKENSLNQTSLIIGITASSKVNFELKCLDQGMDSVLFRPVTRQSLLDEIEKVKNNQTNSSEQYSSEQSEENLKTYTFDYEKALYEFAEEKELLHQALEEFISTLETNLKSMESLLEEKNYSELRRVAHKIRGAAINLTANSLSEIAGMIEDSNEFINESVYKHYLFLINEKKDDFLKEVKNFLN